MSRIGRQPIIVPAGTEVTIEGSKLTVAGPKGTLEQQIMPGLKLSLEGDVLTVAIKGKQPEAEAAFGLMRTLAANMIIGVTQGFERALEVNGVGYKANVAGNVINLSLGFSHPIVFDLPEGVSAKVEKNIITVSGHDKQLVGQVAANLRMLKKPEPYKGKGIKYVEEKIRRKAGKAATKG